MYMQVVDRTRESLREALLQGGPQGAGAWGGGGPGSGAPPSNVSARAAHGFWLS